ncbi:DNA topoisomerase [Kiloniella laminariae]|uniref:DNA topoisomerase n=1 Tax=Kiloniella laminariae TaxID=454162 RepID=A0ABT4LFV7_9PROT|nr:DNA topoisomerase [Kiloniella laminariae]MCZ4279982.1 DNA topoisomerase [Kiloniella laminariae]
MSTIVITEKTSQKRDVQAAIGNDYGRILPAEGHLLSLQEPQQVESSWGRWSFDLLKPDDFYPTCPAPDASPSAKSKLQAIADALKTATRVIIATDCDREGQLIGEEILRHYKFSGKVERAMFTAQDEKTLRHAFAHLEPNEKYFNLGQAAIVRQQADQVYNLSLTRAATVALKQPGQYGAIGIGRVKTPTMAIVCMRELEIRDFTPQDYFHLVATANVTLQLGTEAEPREESGTLDLRHAPKDKILDPDQAEALRAAVEGYQGPIKAEKKIKSTKPPRLLDLPELQKICARRWGWTADKTLNIAQELYDGEGKKIQTYPRAESRYLAENQIEDIGEIIQGLTGLPQYQNIDLSKPEVRKGKSGHFSDAGLKGVSHHAIVPNKNTMDRITTIYPRLTEDEQRMFDLVASSYLAILLPDYIYESTTVAMDVPVTLPNPDGSAGKEKILDFKVTGNIPKEPGWKAVYTDVMEKKDEDASEDGRELPPVQDGDLATLTPVTTDSKKTKAPPRYNEGTLIDAMQNAWRFVEDKELKERLKEAKGIGTPATRASVITGLKVQNFLAQSGKHIIPTEAGLTLYTTLKTAAPELVDPGVTAIWEMHLDDVLEGKQSARKVWDDIGNDTARLINIIKTNAASAPKINTGVAMPKGAGRGKPTDKMKETAKSIAAARGLKLPKGYTSDFETCRDFLDEHLGGKGKTESPEKVRERQIASIEKQLSGGMIRGLGAKAAKQLAESFGPETFTVICEQPEKLEAQAKDLGLSKAKLTLLNDWVNERRRGQELSGFLHSHGVEPGRALRLLQAWPDKTAAEIADLLSADPYCFLRLTRGLPFDMADTLARHLGREANSLPRARAALYHALAQAADYRGKNALLSQLEKRLGLPLDLLTAALQAELDDKQIHLVKDRKRYEEKPAGYEAEELILRDHWQAEQKIGKQLKTLRTGTALWADIEADKAVDWVRDKGKIPLTINQKQTVIGLLAKPDTGKIRLLNGSPNTGKMTVTRAFLRILSAKGFKIALTSTSAGEARALTRDLAKDPALKDLGVTSLVKLLDYNVKTGSFKHTNRKPLDCQLLVITSAALMDRALLLAALDALPEDAGLLLIDDMTRLPAAGSGRVLEELTRQADVPWLALWDLPPELEHNRLSDNQLRLFHGRPPNLKREKPAAEMQQKIAEDKHPHPSRIKDGKPVTLKTGPNAQGSFYLVEAADPADSLRKITEIITNRLPKSFKLDPLRDLQIICLSAVGELGPRKLNLRLQQLLNPPEDGLFVDRFGWRFRVGDKVTVSDNDPERDLLAGDCGIIKDITRDDLPPLTPQSARPVSATAALTAGTSPVTEAATDATSESAQNLENNSRPDTGPQLDAAPRLETGPQLDSGPRLDTGRVTIDFQGKSHDLAFDELDRLSLAYALHAPRSRAQQSTAALIIAPTPAKSGNKGTASATDTPNFPGAPTPEEKQTLYSALTHPRDLAILLAPKSAVDWV